MKRTLILCAAALLLAAPAGAHEKHGKRAKVSKAQLEATEDGSAVRGRAHLVDGRRHDHVSLHMKGLEPGETYLWEVREGACDDEEAAASEGWTYRELTARDSGNANAKGRSKEFRTGDDDVSVAVTLEDGTVIACGDFERARRHGGRSKGKDKPRKP
jgi:hypothetical protein